MAEGSRVVFEHQAKTGAQEWRAHWSLVLSAMVGLSFVGVPSATLGLFMDPLQQDFGWSRAEVAAGMTVMALVTTPLAPFAGALVDKYGARRVALPGIVLYTLAFAAFGLLTGTYAQWLISWVFLALASLLIRTTAWSRAVSGAFTASRGIALAVLLCGLSVSQIIAPIFARWAIDDLSWQVTYPLLAVCWGGVALALLIPWFREPSPIGTTNTKTGPPLSLGGLTLGQAARNSALWRIALATFLQTTISAAIAIHFVPLLIWSGVGRAEAAGIAALLGVGAIAGKIITGGLIDRVPGGLVPFVGFAMPSIAYFLLWQGHGSVPALAVATLIVGYASGSAFHMTAYLTTRYAGLAHFGKIFGIISCSLGLGAGIGPLVAGIAFDRTQSYEALLFVGMPVALLCGFLVAFLGPYPRFDEERGR